MKLQAMFLKLRDALRSRRKKKAEKVVAAVEIAPASPVSVAASRQLVRAENSIYRDRISWFVVKPGQVPGLLSRQFDLDDFHVNRDLKVWSTLVLRVVDAQGERKCAMLVVF